MKILGLVTRKIKIVIRILNSIIRMQWAELFAFILNTAAYFISDEIMKSRLNSPHSMIKSMNYFDDYVT